METIAKTTTKWNLDAAHSEISFKVKHMMISNVSGSFKTFNVDVTTEENDFTTAKIEFTADINSITTGNADRDNHLKSNDFFNAETYPQLKFTSQKFERKDDDNYELTGLLTIRETAKTVKLNVEFGGIAKDPWGNEKAGFTITGKINRTDFGLNWNAALETGGLLVGEEVKLVAEVELVKGN
jgi:polyisoprenoid-binding protein YceI